MIPKEGDELGIEPIRGRLEIDDQIFRELMKLEGVPKVFLKNSIPVSVAPETVDEYEITPGYYYEHNSDGSVKTIEKPWTIKDDNGEEAYSLLPAAVELQLLKQLPKALGL